MGLSVRKQDVAIRRLWLAVVVMAGGALAGDASRPGKLITEVPTLQCLGVRWFIAGDANGNARVEMWYRKVGEERWRRGLDLFRVETRAIRPAHRPPPGSTMFAGSVFGLEEDTAYELKLSLIDPDGGNAERVVKMRTWKEPQLPRGGRRIEVQPGGLRQALKDARPGDILLLHKGVYRGTFTAKSGEPGRPVALVAFGDGPAILDGQGKSNIIYGFGAHDVIIDGLRFRNATWALAFNNASRITVRRCVVTECDYAFVAQKDASRQQHILIADNVFRGPFIVLRSGDRLAFKPDSLKVSLRTRHGLLPLDVRYLMGVSLDNVSNAVHQARFINGSHVGGLLEPEQVTASLRLGGELRAARDMVASIEATTEEAPNPLLTHVLLSNGDELFGRILDEQITLRTDYGQAKIKPSSLREVKFSRTHLGRAVVTLWDNSILRGQMDLAEVHFQVVPGPTISLHPTQIVRIARKAALPPEEVIARADKLVARLGSESHKDRQQATEELKGMGAEIVPILRRHLDTSDPEVLQRLRDIIDSLGGDEGTSNAPAAVDPTVIRQPMFRILR